jgi:hypothetical protein
MSSIGAFDGYINISPDTFTAGRAHGSSTPPRRA